MLEMHEGWSCWRAVSCHESVKPMRPAARASVGSSSDVESPSEANRHQLHPTINRPTCKLTIGRNSYRCLTDTRADISLIWYDTYKQVPADKKLKIANCNHVINSANGPLKIIGKTSITFDLDSDTYRHEFIVTKSFSYTLLLGMDFLKWHSVDIMIGSNQL